MTWNLCHCSPNSLRRYVVLTYHSRKGPDHQETVVKIETLADQIYNSKAPGSIKRAMVKGIPRQAVLKPSHAIYRLTGQTFSLGDRVIMVQDAAAGGVPLAMKGVVVGIGSRDIDVVWDRPFMGGETLNGRCSEYRGSTVPFSACLNLTRPQFAVGDMPNSNPPSHAANGNGQAQPFRPSFGPRPAIAPKNYQPAIPSNKPIAIMRNPGRPGAAANGHGQGPMQYGNAAKGIRPVNPNPPSAPASHQDRLHGALTGRQGGVQQHQHIAHLPKSPTRAVHPLPTRGGKTAHGGAGVVNGQGGTATHPNGNGVGQSYRGRGRGGAGRGGRGRGGASIPAQ